MAGSSRHCLSSEERAAEGCIQLGAHIWFLLSHTEDALYYPPVPRQFVLNLCPRPPERTERYGLCQESASHGAGGAAKPLSPQHRCRGKRGAEHCTHMSQDIFMQRGPGATDCWNRPGIDTFCVLFTVVLLHCVQEQDGLGILRGLSGKKRRVHFKLQFSGLPR